MAASMTANVVAKMMGLWRVREHKPINGSIAAWTMQIITQVSNEKMGNT